MIFYSYIALMAVFILTSNPWLIRLFCLFGWHTYELKKGGKRECKHCKKTQRLIRVGKYSKWE